LTLDRAIAAARADLDRIPDASQWCFNNGYQPLKPNHDRPTALRDPTHPVDFTPGATFDIGIGDYLCRTGWVTARQHLVDAERSIAAMTGLQPSCIRDEDRNIGDIFELVAAIKRRMTFLLTLHAAATPDKAGWISDTLTAHQGPIWRIAEAYAELTTHHHRNGDQVERPTVAMCNICRSKAAEPRRGGKCARCEQRLYRAEHDGYPRAHVIAELRQEAAAELEAAKQRRAAHGPGYGAT
jgi:hypothetical protein